MRKTSGRMAALGGPLEDSTMELELHVGATGASDYVARLKMLRYRSAHGLCATS
jgi:hypothetical protein